ncbi:alpha-glucosidase/alpha-galactosidase [Nitrobacter vulgaris]|uniref:family 4 glycosyl hydrolase n=1 Tax=Nitrobacter vulgaris TaxID=29421 RepID=UPI001FCDDF37|nr:alpha-glucosidase/alpha-galactosidase [Nitrobacter vulgaris]
MIKRCKIVFIGAGSMSFGLSMLRHLFSTLELAGSTLTLVDHDAQSLARMAELAHVLNAASGSGFTIEHTTERRSALDGAGFVINAAAIDRLRLWKLDFEIPRKYGIRHTLGENGGPGGLFFTLRTLPLVFDIVRDMEERCPQALFIDFSNPENRIVLALGRYSRIRTIGLCHGLFMSRDDVARILDMPPAEVAVWGAGAQSFPVACSHPPAPYRRRSLSTSSERDMRYDPSFAPLTRRLFHAFGLWPTCSDEHLGELLAYRWEAGEKGYDFARDEMDREKLRSTIDAVLSGGEVPTEWRTASGERGAAVIAGAMRDERRVIESGIVYNQGAIPNLPDDAAAEAPVMIDPAGIHPVSLGPLPDAIAKLLLAQVNVQQLAVEAAVRASKEIALQALLIDPVVNSATAASNLLEELWEANRQYIRPCI